MKMMLWCHKPSSLSMAATITMNEDAWEVSEEWGPPKGPQFKLVYYLFNFLSPLSCRKQQRCTHSPSYSPPAVFLPILCIHPSSYSLNEFVWTCLVFLQLSEPSGPSQTEWHVQSQSHSPPTHLPLDSMHHTTFLLTKQVRLKSFSASSTFWTIWTLTNTTPRTVPVHLSSYLSSFPFRVSAHLPVH